jgi:anaerobic ribonucleoside-triphosphate reductase activating protein
MSKCLDYIDVVVDGKFEIDKFDPTLLYKGSKNQRIINVAK